MLLKFNLLVILIFIFYIKYSVQQPNFFFPDENFFMQRGPSRQHNRQIGFPRQIDPNNPMQNNEQSFPLPNNNIFQLTPSQTDPAPTTANPNPPGDMQAVPRTTPSPQFKACFDVCPTTSEYNPICGTNGLTYQNSQKLSCAQRCGSDVQEIRRGNCIGIFPITRG